jgi:uncharacterized protein (TIGR02147 family)
MRPIFEYLDYRDLLKDAFEERKVLNPLYSYRMYAEALGLHTSNIFRILGKETHLPARCQSRAVEYLGLSERSTTYFLLLVAYARERNAKARQSILEEAMTLRDVSLRQLGENDLAYFKDWWIAAVRALLEVLDGKAVPSVIASKLNPPVTPDQVAQALTLLQELGLVKKGSSGRLIVGEPHVTVVPSREKVEAVHAYQRQILTLASDSLKRFPASLRDVSTVAMAIDRDRFIEVRGMLRECRRLIQKSAGEAKDPDRAMQLVMAFFPLSNVEEAS